MSLSSRRPKPAQSSKSGQLFRFVLERRRIVDPFKSLSGAWVDRKVHDAVLASLGLACAHGHRVPRVDEDDAGRLGRLIAELGLLLVRPAARLI
jgi:hypothetical protein